MNRKTSKRKLLTFASRAVVVILAFLVLALSPNVLLTQEGDLDLSFGEGGKVTTNFIGSNSDLGSDLVIIQPDGKVVAVGYTRGGDSNNYDFTLARYLSDGSLDTSFGDEGHVTTDFGNYSNDIAFSVGIQADGKIVVVGESNQRFALACYNVDGSLDTGFGDSGLVLTDFGPGRSSARAIAVQNDGKIVVVGLSQIPGLIGNNFVLARYNVDGSLDSSFGTGGLLFTQFPSGQSYAAAVTIQSDGKIVAGGSSSNYSKFALARYNPDGTLDDEFGTNGLVTTSFPDSWNTSVGGVAIQYDGKIVAAGSSYSPNPQRFDFSLARYNVDGSLDLSFGTSGLVTTDFDEADDYLGNLAIQDDGKIVVAGYASHRNAPKSFALVRYITDGSLDTSFGEDGKVDSIQGEARSLAIQLDGFIIAAGTSSSIDTGKNFALARYDLNGSLDASFGTDGVVFDDFLGPNADLGKDIVAVQADGKIVVVGETNTYTGGKSFALARYNRDGSLDASFGEDGLVISDFVNSREFANGVAVQDDGKIVVVGYTYSSNTTGHDFAVARYNTDGSLDISFGVGGLVTTDWFGRTDDANAVAIQADGKILAAGFTNNGNNNVIALARYNPDGSLDTFFGTGGLVTLGIIVMDEANAIAIQSDGKIVIAGQTYTGYYRTRYDFVVARFHTGGNLDTSFGGSGYVTTGFGPDSEWDFAHGVAIQTDGKIVAVGYASTNPLYPSSYEIAMVRYNPDGSLDPSFGIGGLVTTNFDFRQVMAYDVALQYDGKIVVGGTAYRENPWGRDFILARYNTNGSPDPGFGIDGCVTTDFVNTDDYGYALDIQADGKIVLAGHTGSDNPTGTDFALARYTGLKSPDEEIDDIINQIQDLVNNEVLNNGEGNSLLKKLQNALQQLDNDNIGPTINMLDSFINEVNALINSGRLTSEEGQQQISAVQEVIDRLQS